MFRKEVLLSVGKMAKLKSEFEAEQQGLMQKAKSII